MSEKENLVSIYQKVVEDGKSQMQGGDFQEALESYGRGLKIAQELGNVENEVDCLLHMGVLSWNDRKIKESSDYNMQALSLAKRFNLKKMLWEAQQINDIIRLYYRGKELRSKRQHSQSIKSFERAIDLAKKIESREYELKCLRQMSITYWEIFDVKRFFALNEKALDLAKKLKHKREEGNCLNNIGLYYFKINDYSRALYCYQEALSIAREYKNHAEESACLNNIGILLFHVGLYDKALDYLKDAYKIDCTLKDYFNISIELNNIGVILINKYKYFEIKNNYKDALNYFEESLRLSRQVGNKNNEEKVLNNIGSIYLDLKDYSKALKYFKAGYDIAKDLQDVEVMGMILNNIATTHLKMGHNDNARRFYEQAILLGNKIFDVNILWEAYHGLGQCYEQTKEFSHTFQAYEKAIEVIEHVRSQIVMDTCKAGFTRDKIKVYESYIGHLYRMNLENHSKGLEKDIFRMVERAKARAFLESLRNSLSILRSRLSSKMEEEERMISLKISTLMINLSREDLNENDREKLLDQLANAEDEYVVFLSKVRREAPELRYIVSPEHTRLDEVQQKLLDEKTALIEYFLGDEQSFMILITKEDFSLFLLPSIGEIRESIKAYLKILSEPPAGRFKGKLAAHRMYKELVYPAERLLSEEIENLIIIPDGILYYLPFETLIRLMPVESDEASFLISRYRISYAPSCSSLLLLSEKTAEKEHPKSFLAFGNPEYTSKSFNKLRTKTSADILRELYESEGFDFFPLPYSGKEVKKIARFFPKAKRSIYLEEKAQEESLKRISLKDYQVIHFACHGFLDEKAPFRSALVLSLTKGQSEDGFLQVREIYNLRLAADLIVLSACQTGRGTLEKGEGVLGLPRVFFFTGAKSVVSTLWRIGDKPTAQFMQSFYKMLSQGMGKAQAMRLAKMKMLESKYSHPYYWAAFVLNGEPNSCLKFD